MSPDAIIDRCGVCGKPIQMGPHRYEGTWNKTYQLTACSACNAGNWDGWAPHLEERVTQVLRDKGLNIPPRNSKGFLPHE